MTNKQLYEFRKQWLQIVDKVNQLSSLSPEQLEEYDLQMPSSGDYFYVNCGKFIDDWHKYLFLKDQASSDPLTHDEIEKFKEETKEFFNKACQFLYGRNCRFTEPYSAYNSNNYAERNLHADYPTVLEKAIEKATDEITPDFDFYKKIGRYPLDLILKQIDEDIKLCNDQIKSHNASISAIGYEHFEDSELNIPIDYDVNEKYKPHEDAIAHLTDAVKTLEEFKAQLRKDEVESVDNPKTETPASTKTKKQGLFKRIINKVRRKKKTTPAQTEEKPAEEAPKEHAGGA